MKSRKILVIVLILVTLLSVVSAEAAQTRFVSASPSLYFEGTTAYCSGDCNADTMNDEVKIWLYLYEDGAYKTHWYNSGNGYATIDETYSPAVSGKTYKLTLVYIVNNRTNPSVSVTQICP